MNNFDRLTIVFITRNREKYILRNLIYWEQTNVSIIVLDGSEKKIDISRVSSFKNVRYFHLPESIEQRLFFAHELIQTEFVMLAADDDFMIHSGVLDCMNFLDKNQEYVAATGTALRLIQVNDRFYVEQIYPELLKFGNLKQNTSWKRAAYHLNGRFYSNSTIYSIQRSFVFKRTAKIFNQQPLLDGNLMELFIEFSISFLGKSKVINRNVWVRCQDAETSWSTQRFVGEFTLKFRNKNRKILLNLLDQNILLPNTRVPKFIRIGFFYWIFVRKHLFDLFKTSRKIKWILLPFLLLFINLNHSNQNLIKRLGIVKLFFLKFKKSYAKNPSTISISSLHPLNANVEFKKIIDSIKEVN
jgi:glycosyltransferase domain-containing protein